MAVSLPDPSEPRFSDLAERAEISLMMTSVDGRTTWMNAACSRLCGFSLAECVGRKPGAFLQGAASSPQSIAYMHARVSAGKSFVSELVNYSKAGEPYYVRVEGHPTQDADGVLTGFSSLQFDVTIDQVRTQLDSCDRSLIRALAAARTEQEGFRSVLSSVAELPNVLFARAWAVEGASPVEVVTAVTRPSHVPADLVVALAAAAPVLPSTDALAVGFRAMRSDGIAYTFLTKAVHTGRRIVIELCLTDDVPGCAELAERLPRFVATLAQFLERLAENKRFEVIFEHSPDALVVVDGDGQIQQYNAVASALFPQIASGTVLASLATPLALPLRVMTDALATSSVAPFAPISWSITRDNGLSAEVEASFAPIPLIDGRGVLVAVRDVTARRQAEHALEAALRVASNALAEREILLKEVHHRVKNNLQIIASLLGMQSERSVTEEARAVLVESESRIRSMALIHTMLYAGTNLAEVDIGAYATMLATELRAALDPSAEVSFATDSVEISIDQAIPCGLILNELIVNALKHGRSADGRCRLAIEVSRRSGALAVAVADAGPGLGSEHLARRTGSLGLKIIDALVRQLDGTLTTNCERGARFELVLPARAEVLVSASAS